MNADPLSAADLPRVPWRQAPPVLLLLAAAILAITWPWATAFSTHFLKHWDPPFHAWKLEFMARTILSGHLLPPDGDTNMFYPHSGTLFYEALHWPQALVAAPLFGLTGASPVLIYHLVLVFFWALSGLCFWMLLLALGATRRAALLGGLLFTLLPYRISYMVEFNMQLCFGLPLFFFFMVRFFQRPSIRYACGMAVAWWLQAASELYQAVFLLLILPFPGLALLAAHARLLRSFRRFWLPALCAAALGGTLVFVLLGPYLTMLKVHAVERNLAEIANHILEPLSYLRPGGRFHFLTPLDARKDELCVYPTLAVILLTLAHFVFDARRLSRLAAPAWVRIVRLVRWTALLMFVILTFSFYNSGISDTFAAVYSWLPVVVAVATLLVLLHPTERDPGSVFVTGLFGGALFAFFLSLGPAILLRHSLFSADNVLYLWIYKHLVALHGFRVVSRFGIYVLIFLVVAAALAWSRIERRWLHRPALRWLWIAPLLLAAAESYPRPFHFRRVDYPLVSPALDRLDQMPQPVVLAVVPMGDRTFDAHYMLQIGRTDRLFVYAWGGAFPIYTRQVRTALEYQNPMPARAARLLRQLWPECYIVEDKSFFHRRGKPKPSFYAPILAAETEVLAEDDRFVLFRLKSPTKPAEEMIRLIRHDFAVANPLLTFRARTPNNVPSATLWLDVNGYVVGRWEIAPESREFRVRVPASHGVPILANRYRFHASQDVPFFLDAFRAGPADEDPSVVPAPNWPAAECPSWLGHVHDLPAAAIPMDIRYPNGFAILACEPVETTAPVGGVIRLRLYVQCPRDAQVAMELAVRCRLRAPDGQWVEEGTPLVVIGDSRDAYQLATDSIGDLNDICCQIHPGIYVREQSIAIPERLPPGDYELAILLRDGHSRRIAGTRNSRRDKLIPAPIPVRIVPQAPAGP